MHAAALAREFGIAKVVVPAYSSAYSALGCVAARASHTQQRTLRMASRAWSLERLADARNALLRAMAFGSEDPEVDDVALVRYAGQSYSVEVPYDFPVDVDTLARDFRAIHAQLYGFATHEPWEIESIRVTATSRTRPIDVKPRRSSGRERGSPASISRCWFDASKPIETSRYRRDALSHDARIDGPAIVEDAWSTVLVPPGASLVCTEGGHLEMTFATLQ
jgi:N-methylhydantoinase A